MPRLYDSAKDQKKDQKDSNIVVGVVINNCDLIMQGKVLVRIPSRGQEVWARLTGAGAGSGVGFFSVPPADTEVLVAMTDGDPADAFVINGLWSTLDRPPVSLPTDLQTKRIIRTGMTPALGHEMAFDDLKQSVTITTSTGQMVSLSPTSIELSNLLGTVKITMDTVQQNISVTALAPPPGGVIELKGSEIHLQAAKINIEGVAETNVKAVGVCTITGGLVKIN